MADENKPSYPSLMSAIQSSSPRSLLVHPYLWSAKHLEVLNCTFADVDVTHRIIAPVSSPTGPNGLPREGYLYQNDPDSVLTGGRHFSDYIGEILDLTDLGFSGRKSAVLHFKFGNFRHIDLVFDSVRLKRSDPCKIRVYGLTNYIFKPGTRLSQPGKLAHKTMIAMLWQGKLSLERRTYLKQVTPWGRLDVDVFERIVERFNPKPRHHDPYIVSMLLTLARDGYRLWPGKKRARGDQLVHVLMGDCFSQDDPCLRIYSTAVSHTHRVALSHPERRLNSPLPALVIRCATISYKPYDTFTDRLRQTIVAENKAVAASELDDGDRQGETTASEEPDGAGPETWGTAPDSTAPQECRPVEPCDVGIEAAGADNPVADTAGDAISVVNAKRRRDECVGVGECHANDAGSATEASNKRQKS